MSFFDFETVFQVRVQSEIEGETVGPRSQENRVRSLLRNSEAARAMYRKKDLAFFALSTLAAACLFISFAPATAQIPDAPAGYITDLPGLLSGAEREALEQKLDEFENETSNQIFVLIAPELDGRDVFTATFETASKWGIGQADKDNGVLIALYMADRKIRIEVGYGLEGSIPDALANQVIHDVMTPHMRDGSPYLAIDGAVNELIAASQNEYSSTGEALGGADSYSEVDNLYNTFDYGYVPEWAQNVILILIIVYGAISLMYAIVGGIAAKFNHETNLFDLRYDFVEFLSELIATQVLAALAGALPTLALYYIIEEFQIQGYALWIVAPLIIIGLYLRAILRGPADERRRVRETTENLNAWRKLKKKFDADQIEDLRAYFHSRLRRWRPAFVLRTAYEELDKHTARALKSPRLYFSYTEDFARQEIERLLNDSEFWNEARANFVGEEVANKFSELRQRGRRLFANEDYDANEGDGLLKELKAVFEDSEAVFDYNLPVVTETCRAFLEDAALWSKWRMRDSYVASRVNRKHKALRKKFADIQKNSDETKKRELLNAFFKCDLEPVRTNPGRFFKRPEPRRSSSSFAGGVSYSSSSSFSSTASSFGSSSSFGGGGGGSFGGGGASGSW